MSERVRLLFTIVIAFSLGWFARSFTQDKTAPAADYRSTITTTGPAQERVVVIQSPSRSVTSQAPPNSSSRSPVNDGGADESDFLRLLQDGRFHAAIQLFSDQEAIQPLRTMQQWHSALLGFLSNALNRGETALFIDLVDQWLQFRYSDIDVLLLLAQYNRVMDYHSEALQTYVHAGTYALSGHDKQRVQQKLQEYIGLRDAELSDQGYWYELLMFYAELDRLEIDTPPQQFRYAELLLMHGDESAADAVLNELKARGGWEQQIAELRRQFQETGEYQAAQSAAAPGYESSIPMRAVGHHYLLEVRVNGEPTGPLLLDTGATITMLTDEAFGRLISNSGWQDLGSRLFNTANGLVRGRLLQVDEMQLGNYLLKDVKVSVQGGSLGGGVQGLLGMNVLSRFHFKIDQDQHQLMLTPRG